MLLVKNFSTNLIPVLLILFHLLVLNTSSCNVFPTSALFTQCMTVIFKNSWNSNSPVLKTTIPYNAYSHVNIKTECSGLAWPIKIEAYHF